MRNASQILEVYTRIDLDVAERVKVLDRDIQFFSKKLCRIRHQRGSTAKEQALWCRTTLLGAVKLHGLIDLDVQPRHELAGNLGNGRLVSVFRLFVSATKAHETFSDLLFLGFGERKF